MEHYPKDSQPPRKGEAGYFTGEVTIRPLIKAEAPARLQAALVTFAPGARTHWHSHPLGQTLFVTEGRGLAQVAGEPVREIASGDVVWFPPGERHWHGARPDAEMSHLAMQEALDGQTADWAEEVREEDYNASP